MADSQIIEQLRDIHIPPALSWQLAPGWYLLIVLSFFLILVLGKKIIRYYFGQPSAKQIALNLLKNVREEYEQIRDARVLSIQVSELLRRVALSYFPRKQVAGLKGQAWIDFLNQTGKNIEFQPYEFYLLALPYQTQDQMLENGVVNDLFSLIESAENWIKQQGDAHD